MTRTPSKTVTSALADWESEGGNIGASPGDTSGPALRRPPSPPDVSSSESDVVAVDVSLMPVRGEQGDTVCLIVDRRDSTQRKLLERSREEAIGCASHYIGNRLNSIALHAQMLDRALVGLGLSDELRRVRTIAENTQRVAGMLKELLAVTSTESPSPGLALQSADLGDLPSATVHCLPPADPSRERVGAEPSPGEAVVVEVTREADGLDELVRVMRALLSV